MGPPAIWGPPAPRNRAPWGPQSASFLGPPSEIGPPRACERAALEFSMAESGESEYKYSYTAIKEYLAAGIYPDCYDKQSKHGLRKRSKYFILDGGHLMYIGGKAKKTPRLVVEDVQEQMKLIRAIYDAAHLGRDKILSQLNERYYWPEIYKQVCDYVSLLQ